jgi:tripartite-type tricarboxylate transporter receptor subunit TctC
MMRMRLAGALIALLAAVAATSAETYPSRPVTMMVGFPPGGPTDTLARLWPKACSRRSGSQSSWKR